MTKIVILDGSFSAQVSKYVSQSADGDPLWTARYLITSPDSVRNAHLDYLRAGSDIITTNTYQASVDGFRKYLGITELESLDLIKKAVDLTAEAIQIYKTEIKDNDKIPNNYPIIAGSCGPYGASLHDASEYTGAYGKSVSKEFLKDWHRPRINTLINSGVNLLAFETIPCAKEAEALIELLREFPNTKAWLSFSYGNQCTIPDGTEFARIALSCYENAPRGQLVAIGINCCAPHYVDLLLSMVPALNCGKPAIPFIAYPNSGEMYKPGTGWINCQTPSNIEHFIHNWLNLGVQYVGGCCRTTADDIKKIRAQVDTWKPQPR